MKYPIAILFRAHGLQPRGDYEYEVTGADFKPPEAVLHAVKAAREKGHIEDGDQLIASVRYGPDKEYDVTFAVFVSGLGNHIIRDLRDALDFEEGDLYEVELRGADGLGWRRHSVRAQGPRAACRIACAQTPGSLPVRDQEGGAPWFYRARRQREYLGDVPGEWKQYTPDAVGGTVEDQRER